MEPDADRLVDELGIDDAGTESFVTLDGDAFRVAAFRTGGLALQSLDSDALTANRTLDYGDAVDAMESGRLRAAAVVPDA